MRFNIQMIYFYLAGAAIFTLAGINVYGAFEPEPIHYTENVVPTDKISYQLGEEIVYRIEVCARHDIRYDVAASLVNLDESVSYELPTFSRWRHKGCQTENIALKYIPTNIIIPGTYRIDFESRPQGRFRSFIIRYQSNTFRMDGTPQQREAFPFIRLHVPSPLPK
jgi:hypothetical protein